MQKFRLSLNPKGKEQSSKPPGLPHSKYNNNEARTRKGAGEEICVPVLALISIFISESPESPQKIR